MGPWARTFDHRFVEHVRVRPGLPLFPVNGGPMAGFVKAEVLGEEKEPRVDAVGRSTQLPEDTWDYDKTGAKEPPEERRGGEP